jgi:hypothetical protein
MSSGRATYSCATAPRPPGGRATSAAATRRPPAPPSASAMPLPWAARAAVVRGGLTPGGALGQRTQQVAIGGKAMSCMCSG